MPFAYYSKLSLKDQAIYRRSDAVAEIRLSQPALLHPLVELLEQALRSEDRRAVELACQQLASGLCRMLGVAEPRVQVFAVRPELSYGELHGLYTVEKKLVQVWMRTLRHKQVVAFRTFLRTLLHELGHHLDYEHLKLADSFHTEGFFKRESSLFKQLVSEAPRRHARPRPRGGPRTPSERA
jgi:hypothetical protein